MLQDEAGSVLEPRSPLQYLIELGAGRFSHIHTTLAGHLQSTSERLLQWGNNDSLCLAGLFHAVYGTFGLNEKLVDLKDRALVTQIIGKPAEEIVYIYASCNRALTHPEIANSTAPTFYDRFTGSVFVPDRQHLCDFAELTLANEIDVAEPAMGAYLAEHGEYMLPLFRSRHFLALLSDKARAECRRLFDQ